MSPVFAFGFLSLPSLGGQTGPSEFCDIGDRDPKKADMGD